MGALPLFLRFCLTSGLLSGGLLARSLTFRIGIVLLRPALLAQFLVSGDGAHGLLGLSFHTLGDALDAFGGPRLVLCHDRTSMVVVMQALATPSAFGQTETHFLAGRGAFQCCCFDDDLSKLVGSSGPGPSESRHRPAVTAATPVSVGGQPNGRPVLLQASGQVPGYRPRALGRPHTCQSSARSIRLQGLFSTVNALAPTETWAGSRFILARPGYLEQTEAN